MVLIRGNVLLCRHIIAECICHGDAGFRPVQYPLRESPLDMQDEFGNIIYFSRCLNLSGLKTIAYF